MLTSMIHLRRDALAVGGVLVAMAAALAACQAEQAPAPADSPQWSDSSGHEVSFVSVAPDVDLEVLDWGGDGPPLVFLAGLGNTAHAYDDFAPRFRDSFRVVAITRRGFGASSHPDSGYDIDTLAQDVLGVLDSMQLAPVVLAGHSIAAGELTALGSEHPDRVGRLVFLDTYCTVPGTDEIFEELFVEPLAGMPQLAPPVASDTDTVEAYVAYVHRTRGVPIPEADIRARYAADGWNEALGEAYNPVLQAVMTNSATCEAVQVPALAVIARRDGIAQEEPWISDQPEGWPAQEEFERRYGELIEMVVERFPQLIPSGRAEVVPGGHHWVFASHPDAVERLMREFLQ
jgi:pimeloyl-ACP methyl ester carboxylesterase